MRQFLNPKTLRTFQPAQCLVLASTAAKRLRRFEAVVRTASKARTRILIVHYNNSVIPIFLVLRHQFWKISIIDDLNCIFELVASLHQNGFQGARTHGAKGAQRERQPMRQPGNLRVRQVSCTHAGDWQARPLVWQLGAAHQVFGACLILPQALQRSLRACALSCVHSSMLSRRTDRKG